MLWVNPLRTPSPGAAGCQQPSCCWGHCCTWPGSCPPPPPTPRLPSGVCPGTRLPWPQCRRPRTRLLCFLAWFLSCEQPVLPSVWAGRRQSVAVQCAGTLCHERPEPHPFHSKEHRGRGRGQPRSCGREEGAVAWPPGLCVAAPATRCGGRAARTPSHRPRCPYSASGLGVRSTLPGGLAPTESRSWGRGRLPPPPLLPTGCRTHTKLSACWSHGRRSVPPGGGSGGTATSKLGNRRPRGNRTAWVAELGWKPSPSPRPAPLTWTH